MGTDRNIRVLLVDDEEGYLQVLAKRMTRRNLEPTTADSGGEAIRALRRSDFDAAIVDLKMQDMDGIELLKILKTMSPNLPVIILTGHGSETAAREGLALGAFDYLTKPCDLEDLLEKISQARQEAEHSENESSMERETSCS